MSIDDSPITRGTLLRYGAGGAAAVALGALPAVSEAASGDAAATPKRGGTLKFARSIAPTQLDPANSIIAGDVYTLDKIFEPLLISSATGKLTPWLAKSFTVSKDSKTFTFHLRPGVRFSNGKPLTAADVVFSLNRARTNKNGPLSFLDFAIKKLEAKGSSTVVAHLSAPWSPFPSDISAFSNGILPANYGGKTEKEFFANPIGTGPFVLDGTFTASAPQLTLKRNPSYWQKGKPYLDAVVLLNVNDDNQRVLQLRGGQADLIDSVPPANVKSLNSGNTSVKTFPAWQADLLVFNEKLPQFKDRNVRRAISYAIDRPALVKAASFGTARPGGSFFPPSLQYYSAKTPVLTYNVAKAKAELAKSAKYGKGLKASLLIDGGVQKWRTFAQIIQQQLKAIGIDVTIRPLDHAAYHDAFEKFDYEMFIDYAINDISDPDEMASFEVDFKNGGSTSYWSSYDNPAAIKLVHQAQAEFNPQKRAALYAKIQAVVAQDVPFVTLDYPPYIYAQTSKVQGFAANPGGAYRLEDVWLT